MRINVKIGTLIMVNQLILDFGSELLSSSFEKNLNRLVITRKIMAKIKITVPHAT